ncbi:MAG: hypothetical protein CM1200mP27_05080 [Chloroflexota bacterium]|nr:MAG: hypothetical protein CM1200mP27_05080 [Chloroflexota bacterium]
MVEIKLRLVSLGFKPGKILADTRWLSNPAHLGYGPNSVQLSVELIYGKTVLLRSPFSNRVVAGPRYPSAPRVPWTIHHYPFDQASPEGVSCSSGVYSIGGRDHWNFCNPRESNNITAIAPLVTMMVSTVSAT